MLKGDFFGLRVAGVFSVVLFCHLLELCVTAEMRHWDFTENQLHISVCVRTINDIGQRKKTVGK